MSDPDPISRRALLQIGLGAAAGAVGGGLLAQASSDPGCGPTPPEIEGPFYPTRDQPDENTDLTRITGHAERAEGDVVYLSGQVLDDDCRPIAGALVEIWQANRHGRYHHERDPNPAPVDPHFQGWGETLTDEQGRYSFKTILPGAYPADEARGWWRPPHIHFRVSKRGYRELVTQMYFAGQELNAKDLLFNELSAEEQAKVAVALKRAPDGAEPGARAGRFDIGLRRVG